MTWALTRLNSERGANVSLRKKRMRRVGTTDGKESQGLEKEKSPENLGPLNTEIQTHFFSGISYRSPKM